eukprot:Clim_evm4s243 gene=Clim_evmTU4s243
MVAEDKFTDTKHRLSLEGIKEINDLRTSGFDHLGDQGIPTLDLKWAFSSELHKRQAAQELEIVMRNVGFFLLENHGADLDLRERLDTAARRFFHLSDEVKENYHVDEAFRGYLGFNKARKFMNEAFVPPIWVHEDNQRLWPEEVPELKMLTLAWIEQLREIGYKLNRLIALRVGYEQDEDFFNREYFGNDGRYPKKDYLRLNMYPKGMISNAGKDTLGMDAHSDFGWLTLLSTDGNAGLQILSNEGNWIEPEIRKDQLVVNLGDFMQRLTNDCYSSTLHRVHNPKGMERLSIACFFSPFNEITGSVFPSFVKDGEEPKYEPVSFGRYIEDQREKFYKRQLNQPT